MDIESLIKELIDEITGVSWSPGAYPRDLTVIKSGPVGSWNVSAGSGESTSTRRMATVETNVGIGLWAIDPEARATAKRAVLNAFVNVGFTSAAPADVEIMLPDQSVAYVTTMTFKGWIDTDTYWVYKNNQ